MDAGVPLVEFFDGADDVGGGFFALDADAVEEDVEAGEAAVGGSEDVVDDTSPVAAGDDGDALGEARGRGYACVAAFEVGLRALEFVAKLAEGEFQYSSPLRKNSFDVNLDFALRLVEFDRPADNDIEAVGGFEFEAGEGVFPEDAGEFGGGVFQSEESVATVVGAEVGDFALDEEGGRQCAVEKLIEAGVDLGDGPGVGGCAALGHLEGIGEQRIGESESGGGRFDQGSRSSCRGAAARRGDGLGKFRFAGLGGAHGGSVHGIEGLACGREASGMAYFTGRGVGSGNEWRIQNHQVHQVHQV